MVKFRSKGGIFGKVFGGWAGFSIGLERKIEIPNKKFHICRPEIRLYPSPKTHTALILVDNLLFDGLH